MNCCVKWLTVDEGISFLWGRRKQDVMQTAEQDLCSMFCTVGSRMASCTPCVCKKHSDDFRRGD